MAPVHDCHNDAVSGAGKGPRFLDDLAESLAGQPGLGAGNAQEEGMSRWAYAV